MAEFVLDDGKAGDWTVLTVAGEVDLATAPAFRERLVELIAGGDHHLVVDLSATDFLDSTGLGAIVTALKRIRGHGGDIRLVIAHDRIRKVFEITSLDRVFTIFDSVDAAVA